MRYIISGGGTGGHIYPALAIGKEILERDKEAKILYVGTKNSLENELAIKHGFEFSPIHAKGLPRRINLKAIKSVLELSRGVVESGKIIKTFKPDIVIGTGGYVCAPIIYKAQRKGIHTFIQEQNAFPGKTNKLLANKANIVALSFDEAKKYFNRQDNLVITGNPIRKEITVISREDANKKFSYNLKNPIVLSFGGSGGQESTNNALLEILNSEVDIPFHLIHITGKSHYDNFLKHLEIQRSNVEILPYSHNIPELLKLSTLVIASSSAMTLAEISAVGVASILIPKSYTAGNHQYYNAISYRDSKASEVIMEEDLNGNLLLETINRLLSDKEKLNDMGKKSALKGNPLAVNLIVNEIEKIIKR